MYFGAYASQVGGPDGASNNGMRVVQALFVQRAGINAVVVASLESIYRPMSSVTFNTYSKMNMGSLVVVIQKWNLLRRQNLPFALLSLSAP